MVQSPCDTPPKPFLGPICLYNAVNPHSPVACGVSINKHCFTVPLGSSVSWSSPRTRCLGCTRFPSLASASPYWASSVGLSDGPAYPASLNDLDTHVPVQAVESLELYAEIHASANSFIKHNLLVPDSHSRTTPVRCRILGGWVCGFFLVYTRIYCCLQQFPPRSPAIFLARKVTLIYGPMPYGSRTC